MSKARSPREVCSTTIGTIGLIGAAVYRDGPAAKSAGMDIRSKRGPLPLLWAPSNVGGMSPNRVQPKGETELRKLTIICVSAAALVVPASAMANTIRQEGQIVRDDKTLVKLRVETKGGDAVKVGGFKAKNVVVRCDDGPSRITFTALTPVKVDSDNHFKVRLSDGEGGILRISGKVKDNGHATVGNLKTNDFKSGKQTCRAPKQRFKTHS
jgi:hypothetical protein